MNKADLPAFYAWYSQRHANKKNILIHWIAIPVVMFSVLALLAQINFKLMDFPLNFATLFVLFLSARFVFVDPQAGFILAFVLVGILTLVAMFLSLRWKWTPLLAVVLIIAGIAAQEIGHRLEQERKKYRNNFDVVFSIFLEQLFLGPLFFGNRAAKKLLQLLG